MKKRYVVVVDPHNERGKYMEEVMAEDPFRAAVEYIGKNRVKRTLIGDTTLDWWVYEAPEDWHRSEFVNDEEAMEILAEEA